MRSSLGLLLVPVLGLGACADEGTDWSNPRPFDPTVAPANEPTTEELVENYVPLVRPGTAELEGITTPDSATIGRRARAAYDRLHATGLIR